MNFSALFFHNYEKKLYYRSKRMINHIIRYE